MNDEIPTAIDGVSPHFIAALRERAELHADLVGRAINELPTLGDSMLSLTAGQFLDLAAVVQLREWERLGHQFHVQAGLPSFDESLSLFDRTILNEGQFPGWSLDESLSAAVLRLVINQVSWTSQGEWGVDIFLTEIDEEGFLNSTVEVLWGLYRANANLLEESSHET